jgi:hypothetical protein
LAIDSGRIYVGAPFDSVSVGRPGAVYIFEKQGAAWMQITRVPPVVQAGSPNFGISVAASGATMVVGANNDSTMSASLGAAYVFERDAGGAWIPSATLFPSLIMPQSNAFGEDVAMDGDTIVVGGTRSRVQDVRTGAGFVFRRALNEWQETAYFVPESKWLNSGMGYRIAMAGGYAFFGAPNDGPPARSGSVTIARLAPPLPGDADADGVVGMKDITAVLTNFGASYPDDTSPGDADHNGLVNFADAVATLTNWGASCP